MDVKILPAARARLSSIWDYTEPEWGASQADKYLREMVQSIHDLPEQTWQWRPVRRPTLPQVFFIRYQHHYIFFRKMKSGNPSVISVLHESMNLPAHVKGDRHKSRADPD